MSHQHPITPPFLRASSALRRPLVLIVALLALAALSPARASGRSATLTVFSLGALNGPNGFRLAGGNPGDGAGRVLENAGDVNGDGLDDFIIGAPTAAPGGAQRAGEAYVIFGTATNPAALPLNSLNGQNGFRLTGALANGAAGEAVGGGDINGDGLADVLVGAPGASHSEADATGAVYVVFGAPAFPARVDLGALDGSRGFRVDGVAEDARVGGGVGYGGDLNGDGLGDIVIGAPNAAVGGKTGAGQVYVLFGRRAFPPRLGVDELNGAAGLRIDGIEVDGSAGRVVGGAGDVNSDGYDDAFIAAPIASRAGAAEAGAVYVLFGQATFAANLDLNDLTGATGFRIEGEAAFDHAGSAVEGGGDVNGDGRADLAIGAPDAAGHNGRAYVVLGSPSSPNVLSLGGLNGSNGARLLSDEAHGAAGAGVALGDVNGDGYDDVIVGAAAGGSGSQRFAGRTHVVFGRPTLAATVDLGAPGGDGLRIDGAASGEQAGQAIGTPGDRDGDGFDELLIGAPNSGVGPGGRNGAAFIVQGGPTLGVPNPVTHPGGPGDDTLTGTAGADVLHGHRGHDQLAGEGGDDVLKGGQGHDTLRGGAGSDALLGGNGSDTASYAGSPAGVSVDLFTGAATGGDAAGDRLRSIENLTGSAQADTLTGDAGPNALAGGPGDDTLSGGRGDDRYVFAPNGGNDTLTGFAPGAGSEDTLDFTALPAVNSAGDLIVAAAGGDTLITLPDGATIRLKNVAPSALHGDDYRFAGAPLARPDQYTTPANAPLSVTAPGVLANDDNPLATPLTAVLVTEPAHGSVTLNADGSFTYTPAIGFAGEDQFTYRANNGQPSNAVAVTIAVTPRPPVAVADSYTVMLGETLTVAAPGVLANDQNPGGAPLTAILVEGPLEGTLALAADGSLTYTSTAEFPVLDSFTYRATNGQSSNVATVRIAVVQPDGPPLAADDAYSAPAGQNLVVAAPGVLANDANPTANPMTAILADGPTHGTLALAVDGSFTYTAQAGYHGLDQFTYRASNGQLSNVATVRITVTAEGFQLYLPVAVRN